MFSKKTAAAIALLVLFVLFAVVLTLTGDREDAAHPVKGITLTLVAPFMDLASGTASFLSGLWEEYFAIAGAARENQQLKKDLDATREALAQCREAARENDRLRTLLGFSLAEPYPLLPARVVGEDPTRWFKSVVIDRGSKDGVRRGDPVVSPLGVVGRVTQVAPGYSLVLLIIDPNHAMDVRILRNRTRGVVVGGRTSGCRLKYVLKKEDVRIGDVVVTSGLDTAYPKGLVVGTVSEIANPGEGMFQEITVVPGAHFDKLEEVSVVVGAPELPQWEPS